MAFVTTAAAAASSTTVVTGYSSATRTALRRPSRVALPSASRRAHQHVPSMSVTVGSPAVPFTLPATKGLTLSLKELVSSAPILVLYFYPRDATPGCTTEATDFRDLLTAFRGAGAAVVGVSRDSLHSHDLFARDHKLTFPLVADDGTLCEGYGVWKKKMRGDEEVMGVERSTFVIKDGVVVKEWRGVKSAGHAAEVLEAIQRL